MEPSACSKRYLARLGLSFLVFCLLAAAVNFAVDPYGLFASPRIQGFNALKPAAPDRIRFTKPYFADQMRAHTVIAGNSRPEMGLDPLSPCWSPDELPVFNAGVPGIGLAEQIRFAEHSVAGGAVDTIYLGLDLLDFLVKPDHSPDYSRWPGDEQAGIFNLRVKRDGSLAPRFQSRRMGDWLKGLFSLETLSDSFSTVLQQWNSDLPTRRVDGFNPALEYRSIIRAEGQSVLFAQKNREIARILGRPNRDVYQGDRAWSWEFETLERFLIRAKRQGHRVVLFTNPYHAEYLAAIRLAGHWGLLERWKTTLTGIAERHRVPLWDFQRIDAASGEVPPPPGNKTATLAWFWEPAHYRAELGDRMLSAMLQRECRTTPTANPPFGTQLTSKHLPVLFERLRDELDTYLRLHPDTLDRLNQARASLGEGG